MGQVSVRVMPATCWTFGTTVSCRSLIVSAPMRATTSYGPVTYSAEQHTGQLGQLFGDDLGAADIGLDQHESLDHPVSPPFRCIDSTPQGPKVPQDCQGFSARMSRQEGAMASDEPADSLAGLGEFAVIDRLIADRDQPAVVVVGPGDDAAVVIASDGRTVVSTDMLVEGRHFRRDWSTPRDVGRKAIAQNAADIEAMGAAATAFVVAFGAPGDTSAAAGAGTRRRYVAGGAQVRRRDRRRRSGQRSAVGDLGNGARRPGRTRTGAALRSAGG